MNFGSETKESKGRQKERIFEAFCELIEEYLYVIKA